MCMQGRLTLPTVATVGGSGPARQGGTVGTQVSRLLVGLDRKSQWRECKYLLHCHGDITALLRNQFHSLTAGGAETGKPGPSTTPPFAGVSLLDGLRKRQGDRVVAPRADGLLWGYGADPRYDQRQCRGGCASQART